MDNINKNNCDNVTSVENQYIVAKLIEQAQQVGKGELHFNQHVKDIKSLTASLESVRFINKNCTEEISKQATKITSLHSQLRSKESIITEGRAENERLKERCDLLTEKDAEITKLEKEIFASSSFLIKISNICYEAGFNKDKPRGIDVIGEVETAIKSLQATIKSSDAEANSYRELYNELKNAVLINANVAEQFRAASTPKEVLHELQCIKNEVGIYEETSLKNANDYQASERKYNRLVACIEKECKRPLKSPKNILPNHRINEKTLRAQRKGGSDG